MSLTGQNVDLTRCTLTVEGSSSLIVSNFSGVESLDSGVGTDTNQDWNPFVDLQPTYAISSDFSTQLFPAPGFEQMEVSPSIPYFYIAGTLPNIITRAAFLNANPGAGVVQQVYFGGHPSFIGNGAVTIQWSAPYIDPTTGQQATNYLYLNDYYAGGANTNNTIFPPGIPSNFTLTESHTPVTFPEGPSPSGFPTYLNSVVTNNYTYFDVDFTGTTVATNNASKYVTNNLAIMPGRLQISSSVLNLSHAIINGPNYMSLTAGIQFNGSQGATISSPYTDFNLAVTNGFMTISNLLEPTLADWSGSLQAWTADWLAVDSLGNTNDNRVLLVNPDLNPVTKAQVQHLLLTFATNNMAISNLVISDVLNIIGAFNANAQSLTLTTNGTGATSPDGELNILANGILWQTSLPNLLNLTNYGAIRLPNAANFGSSTAWYQAFINNSLILDQGSQIWATNFQSDGMISNGVGSFTLNSQTATFTNGSLIAGIDVSITAGSLVTSNLVLQTKRSLTLQATNQITDTGVNNGNVWTVGSTNGTGGNGVVLAFKPILGDLLGTTITNYAPPPNKIVNWTWAGQDFGVSTAGYTNNTAVGRLMLDALANGSAFSFSGTGTSNAIYLDYLGLLDSLTNGVYNSYDFSPWLTINTNIVIYFAQAVVDGVSVAEKINEASLQGKNGGVVSNGIVIVPGRLRWIPMYAGHFSSTNIVYAGVTNTVNAALAQSKDLDSDGDNILNAFDSSPIFVPAEVNFTFTLTNVPPLGTRLTWDSIPSATNIVLYETNLVPANWQTWTSFVSSSTVPPLGGWPLTNSITITMTNNPAGPYFYRVIVAPNNFDTYGY